MMLSRNTTCHQVWMKIVQKNEFEKYCIILTTPTDKYVKNDSSVNKDIKVCVN